MGPKGTTGDMGLKGDKGEMVSLLLQSYLCKYYTVILFICIGKLVHYYVVCCVCRGLEEMMDSWEKRE